MNISVSTKGHYDTIDITEMVQEKINESNVDSGMAFLFVDGSTAALTTIEYEEGVIKDLKNLFEDWAPEDADYEHHKRWGDGNGAAHMKSAILGTDLFVPFDKGKLQLGTWQQIVLIDFDEKPRHRNIIVKILPDNIS